MPRQRDERGRFMPNPVARANAAPSPEREQAGPSEPFLSELQASWARHGAATIETVRVDRPHDYLRLMASSLGKLTDGKTDALEAMSDDEIAAELRRVLDRLGAEGVDPGAGAGAPEDS